jgi:nucleolar protein 56
MKGSSTPGWFAGVPRGDREAAREAIESGRAEEPADWPSLAVETGFAPDEADYYDALNEATVHAAEAGARERERADDQQLIHALRAMDDCRRTANELAERVSAWGSSLTDEAGSGVEYASTLAGRESESPLERRLTELAARVVDLDDQATALRRFVERTAPAVAPNLAAMAGPVLAGRLIAQAGGLEALAKLPSGTVQVLGAEDALFAHLQGGAPSPKHGIIFTHEYVRGTTPEHRGSAARALAGKLTIAARVDHYGGDRRPSLDRELDERIARIRERETA